MAARLLKIPTTRRQRQIVPVALDLAKKLAQDVASGSSRLGLADGPAMGLVGNLAYIRGEFDKVLPGESANKIIEIDVGAAQVFRHALRLWGAVTIKKDHALQLQIGEGGKSALTASAEKAMQDLLDVLNDQLSLPFENIVSVDEPKEESDAEFAKGTSPGPHRGVGKHRKPEDTPEGAGKRWDRTHQKKKK